MSRLVNSTRSVKILAIALALVAVLGLASVWAVFSLLASLSRAQQGSTVTNPTRVSRGASPTKFARVLASDTAAPTDAPTVPATGTPANTRVRTPTRTLAPTRTRTNTRTPNPSATKPSPTQQVSVNQNGATAPTAEPAGVQLIPPTLAATPTAEPSPTVKPTSQILGVESLAGPARSCDPIPDVSYEMLWENSAPSDRPGEHHPDLNLALRSYAPTIAPVGFVDYDGAGDYKAPQLYGLFPDQRTPKMIGAYRVYDWDWSANLRGGLIDYPPVTLAGLEVTPGEILLTPPFGGDIGGGRVAMVLYAAPNRITLEYTREDTVANGYTIHLEGICVEPRLLAAYRQGDSGGRHQLPALRAGQPIGRANGAELGVAVRDRGTFMDPRARKDWWIGR